jgi:myo-inositol 2-dehydrogenase / D-chiro-inositol 1-dehydrogenase
MERPDAESTFFHLLTPEHAFGGLENKNLVFNRSNLADTALHMMNPIMQPNAREREATFSGTEAMKTPAHASLAARTSRRAFLKHSTALAGAAMLSQLPIPSSVRAAGSDAIKVGLIGCGNRGTGAARNALNAGRHIRLVALADVFPEKTRAARDKLKSAKPGQVAVDNAHCFTGFDAYEHLIASDVDVVLIAGASHFIPMHLAAAIRAGKHVFCEKPHGIDVPGVKAALAASEEAREKKLSLVSGLCWRYDHGVRETMKRVQDGAIGEIVAIQETYVSAPYYAFDRQPGWSEFEYQMRNWYHFNWLSGDQTAQQLIHSLDKASWALGDRPPLRLWGLGGRQTCVAPKFGDQFDHQSVIFEYSNGVRVYGFTRNQEDCYRDTSDYLIGTKGRCDLLKHRIEGETNWAYSGTKPSMYDVEHQELFDAIRSGKPVNNGHYMCLSTMLAVAAQIAIYTGQSISWEQALSSKRSFTLPRYGWDVVPPVKPNPDGRYDAPLQGKAEFEKWLMDETTS